MIGWRPLAGGNISGFSQAEGEAAAFFEANLRHFSLAGLRIARIPTHEKTGRLNR